MTTRPSPRSRSLIRAAFLTVLPLVCVVFTVFGCIIPNPATTHTALAQDAGGQNAGGEAAPPEGAKEPIRRNVRIPGTDEPLAKWIIARWAEVPLDVTGLKRDALTNVQMAVDDCVNTGEFHTQKFPKSKARCEILTILAQSKSLNRKRYRKSFIDMLKAEWGDSLPREEMREQVNDEMEIYTDGIIEHTDEALTLKPTPALQARLFQVRGDILHYKRLFSKAADDYQRSIDAEPKGPFADRSLFAAMRALLDAGKYAASREAGRTYLKRYPRTARLPEIVFLMHQANRREGRLIKGAQLWQEFLPSLRAGARGEAIPGTDGPEQLPWIIPAKERSTWEDYHGRGIFYQGFFAFARGDFDEATKNFNAFLDYFDELGQKGIPVPQPIHVYRQFQAVPYVTTLSALVNQDAKDVGVAAPDGVEPSVVLFSNMSNAKGAQRELIEQLDDIGGGSNLYWIASPGRVSEDPDQTMDARMEQLRELAKELDFPGELGLDDTERTYHDLYFINPGTASLFLFDAAGKTQWHLIYPTHNDAGLIRSALEAIRQK